MSRRSCETVRPRNPLTKYAAGILECSWPSRSRLDANNFSFVNRVLVKNSFIMW
jgi:hypothetical protein